MYALLFLTFDRLLQGWTAVNVLETMQKVVARASNRGFVGLPLCTFSCQISLSQPSE